MYESDIYFTELTDGAHMIFDQPNLIAVAVNIPDNCRCLFGFTLAI
jgi:hypothetical protein